VFRLAELENPVRQHGIKLGDVADRKASVDELRRASLAMRAQNYRVGCLASSTARRRSSSHEFHVLLGSCLVWRRSALCRPGWIVFHASGGEMQVDARHLFIRRAVVAF
jgi:hypothetical protein